MTKTKKPKKQARVVWVLTRDGVASGVFLSRAWARVFREEHAQDEPKKWSVKRGVLTF